MPDKPNVNINNSNVIRLLFCLLILSVAVFYLFINIKMPFVGEDYSLQPWAFNSAPLSFFDKLNAISHRIYYQATTWNPRIGEQLAIITAVFPKIIFDVINTALFIWLTIVLFVLGYGRFPNWSNYFDGVTLFLIIFLIFTLFPLLGQVFFWKAGACNHFWGLVIILSFILPFRLNFSKKVEINGLLSLILYILLGFFAGLTIENVSATVIVYLLVYYIISYHKNSINRKFIYPLIADAIGISILLFSPGTAIRRSYYSRFESGFNLSQITLYINRFFKVNIDLIKITWALFVVLLVSLTIYLVVWHRKSQARERNSEQKKSTLRAMVIMFFMAYPSVLILTTIPYQSDQQRAFTFFWLITISLIAYLMTEILRKFSKKALFITVTFFILLFVFQMTKIGIVYTHFSNENEARMQIIDSALKTGKEEINLPYISTPDSRVLETREILGDLGDRYAAYYGFSAVKIEKK